MRLIVQIPCYNEELTLPATLADIPRQIPGISVVEILVIDDGSSDRTVEVARAHGVEHILVNKRNMGLARTFRRGLEASLHLGADVIVNTDGDNQYCGADIPKLIAPIVAGNYDVVIGDRQTSTIAHFSGQKRLLQTFGSFVVRRFSGVNVPDAVSGFRAISRDAALKLNIVSTFSYTIEMLIQVGRKNIAVTSVPIRTNDKTRDSRLFKSIFQFIERSGTTLLRMYAMYQPLRVFMLLGTVFMVVGAIPIVRFLILFLMGQGEGKIQSLVIGGAFVIIGLITLLLGIIADLIGHNRQLLEMTLEKVRRLELAEFAEVNEPPLPVRARAKKPAGAEAAPSALAS
jgi:glycosyltransferase involved in cell wall biosynthesis